MTVGLLDDGHGDGGADGVPVLCSAGPRRRVAVHAPALTADMERHWAAILRPLGNPE